MNATARDFNSDPASTEGLEQVFADATHCESNATQCDAVASHTIFEASQILKVSPSTIYRRIKAGRYETETDQDGTLKVIVRRTDSQVFADATHCELNATQCEAVAMQCESDATQCEAVATTDNELAKAFKEMAHQLQHATYRNGWLESKLEEVQKERDQAIKLLTDSQHRPSWWAKLSSWFLKAQ